MLRTRESGGYKVTLFFRNNAKRYVFFIVYFGLLLAFTAFFHLWTFFAVLVGIVFGSLLRDVGWVRSMKRSWPFTLEIVDWNRVQKLADEG